MNELSEETKMSLPSYSKIHALGHAYLKNLFLGDVVVEEKVDGCVSPETPILKADLTYIRAGDLKVGDVIIGFDENLNDSRLKKSKVTVSKPIVKECYRVKFTDRVVIASYDHPWLVRQKTNNNCKTFVQTRDLMRDHAVVSIPVWEKQPDWKTGYVAGFFDGEGSLVRSKNQRVLSVYQTIGPTLDKLLAILFDDGFHFSVDIRQRKIQWKKVASCVLRGGTWTEILRFLGTYRPQRLLDQADKIWIDAPMNFIPDTQVVSIEPIGQQIVQGLSTTTKT